MQHKEGKKITLICKGDNRWTEVFDTEESAYWFLYGIVSEKERYGGCKKHQHEFAFDCEDDLIIWEQDGKKKYCAGWHWGEEQEEEQIVMPNGMTLYNILGEIEDN